MNCFYLKKIRKNLNLLGYDNGKLKKYENINFPHLYTYTGEDVKIYIKCRKRSNLFTYLINLYQHINELNSLIILNNYIFQNITIQKLIYGDDKIIITNNIDGNFFKIIKNQRNNSEKIENLNELHHVKYTNKIKIQKNLNLSIILGAYRRIINFEIILGIKIILLLIYLNIKNKKQPNKYFIHGDLINHRNSLIDNDGKLTLVDFGHSCFESKWVMVDYIDLIVNENLLISVDAFNILKKCSASYPEYPKLGDQIRIALLRRIVHRNKWQPINYEIFLNSILLSNEKYYAWYGGLIGKSQ